MRAVCWNGTRDIRVENVPDPTILSPGDAIIKVTATAICGSDVHLYDGFIPSMEKGDILGHEFMGIVVEVGSAVRRLQVGDRVVVPFPIACGRCFACDAGNTSLCENSNPNAWMAEKLWGHSPCGIFGYSHLTGGYAGGQAEYVRVPYAEIGPIKIPDELDDEQVLFLSDILPTGWMAAEACNIQPSHVVAVWGCGPVGQFTIASALLLGAARVIAIDTVPDRLRMAAEQGAVTIDYQQENVADALQELTAGRGPDACIDAVGLEAHAPGVRGLYHRAKTSLMLETDRPHALHEAFTSCRNGGTVSVPGVYGGFIDKVPFGSIMNRSLTIKTGQTHVHRYLAPLLGRIARGDLDPRFIITHRLSLDDAPDAYAMFTRKQDACMKVVLRP
jgi:threonine dehydrogenase-like Zn-dependent dehydrogenase